MARYIDADKLIEEIDKAQAELKTDNDALWGIYKKTYNLLCRLRRMIDNIPTADVVPKSEVEATVEKLMSATDKVICEAKAEVAREIFEEIDIQLAFLKRYGNVSKTTDLIFNILAELKKKYTEGEE